MPKIVRVSNPGVIPGAVLDLGSSDTRFVIKQGPPGPSGAGVVAVHYRFDTPSATWTIIHNKAGKPPVALFLDSAPNERIYTEVEYPDDSTIVVEWDTPESGDAYL